jgi:hypothetical protein
MVIDELFDKAGALSASLWLLFLPMASAFAA